MNQAASDPRIQALYARIMRVATGPLTDQKISLYATCDPQFAVRLPPLTEAERREVLSHIKPPFVANPKATDRVLCHLAVRSWARDAANRAMPQIRADLEREYWAGDPENSPATASGRTPAEPALQTLAPRTGLGTKIKGALGRLIFGPADEEQ